MIGSRIAAEAPSRGHEVTAATRSGSAVALPEHPAPTPLAPDASVPGEVAEAAAGHDAVVCAVSSARVAPTRPPRSWRSTARSSRGCVRAACAVWSSSVAQAASGPPRGSTVSTPPTSPRSTGPNRSPGARSCACCVPRWATTWTARTSPRPRRLPLASAPVPSGSAATSC
ncbi:NAD(P)H-binding protein [Streptomyces boncukensis]|uniref:NAD(P)H-binding protein n=1 Tax=Streptomyces boncukensis TaxID=2711219 RepID=UPI003B96AB2C